MRKKYLKLLPVLGMLLVSLVMLLATTLAWLAMNKNVSSNGMQMQIEVTPNLVISDTVTSNLIVVDNESPYVVSYATSNTHYAPATHDLSTTGEALMTPSGPVYTYLYPSGLKFVNNPEAVSPSTGESNGTALVYSNAVNGNPGTQYYVDKTVYIASLSQAMTDVKLICTIDSALDPLGNEISSGSLMATSIDIYQDSASGANYIGTINVAKSAGRDLVYVVGGVSTTGTIPLASETNGYLTFVLRFYFDGALESSVGQAYIYSNLLDLDKITINVKFYVPNPA